VSPTSVKVTVLAGGPADITLGAQFVPAVVDEHTFTNVAAGTAHLVVATNSCGSAARVSVVTLSYCPSLRLDTCNCAVECGQEIGYGYRDNALRDPAATVEVTHCTGEISYVYPAPGVYGGVRAEVPYYDGGDTVVGYLANNSDCAPDVAGITVAQNT
jgi:hypothetical protein